MAKMFHFGGDRLPQLAQRADGCYTLSFDYGDYSFRVVIDHHHANDETEYRVEMWSEGDCVRFETAAQREARHQIMKDHDDFDLDTCDDGYVHFSRNYERPILERVLECLDRWHAVRMIVSPHVSL